MTLHPQQRQQQLANAPPLEQLLLVSSPPVLPTTEDCCEKLCVYVHTNIKIVMSDKKMGENEMKESLTVTMCTPLNAFRGKNITDIAIAFVTMFSVGKGTQRQGG